MAGDKTDKTDKTPAAASIAVAAKMARQKEYWERVSRDISTAMEALPLREFGADEPSISQRAEILASMAGFALVNRLERANGTRKKDGMKNEALAIRHAAAKLYRLLERAHGDTLEALERAAKTDPQSVPMQLHPLVVSTHLRALANLANVAALDARPQAAKPGNKEKEAAAQVADFVLESFEDLTGRSATRTWDFNQRVERGAFMDFLAAVFKALGMSDSPRSQGKDAIGRRYGVNPLKKWGKTP